MAAALSFSFSSNEYEDALPVDADAIPIPRQAAPYETLCPSAHDRFALGDADQTAFCNRFASSALDILRPFVLPLPKFALDLDRDGKEKGSWRKTDDRPQQETWRRLQQIFVKISCEEAQVYESQAVRYRCYDTTRRKSF